MPVAFDGIEADAKDDCVERVAIWPCHAGSCELRWCSPEFWSLG